MPTRSREGPGHAVGAQGYYGASSDLTARFGAARTPYPKSFSNKALRVTVWFVIDALMRHHVGVIDAEAIRVVAIVVFDGVKMLDAVGPAEVFVEANRFG